MATRHVAPRQVYRRSPVGPTPLRPKRKRFRWFRRILTLLIILAIGAILAWGYVQQIYAPGLRQEALRVPGLVRQQLNEHNAPYLTNSQMSPDLQHAIVAIEDRRFYSHPGVDPLGIIRAFWVNLTEQHVDQGGSTLEQQLAKRVVVHDDRTLHGKLRTAGIAWAIDQEFSKARIIELYLNAAYYGQGAYGVAEAAHTYFATDALHLTLPQAAFIAALPQAPSVYGDDPTAPAIRERWRRVLLDMEQLGYITPAQEKQASGAHLTFALPNP